MTLRQTISRITLSLSLFGTLSLSQSVNGADYDSPSAGPPASYFAAATSLPVAALSSAAAKASKVPSDATYAVNYDSDSPTATIHSDWAAFSSVSITPRTKDIYSKLMSRVHHTLS